MFSLFGRKKQAGDAALAGRRKLYIPEVLYRRMINQCLEERPLEACGLFGGASGHVTMALATDNAERSPILYRVDERQLIAAHREIQAAKQEIIGIYHSHVKTDPVPSLTDIEQATFPEAFYVIVSLAHRRPLVRAWQIVDRHVTEHQVIIQKDLPGTWRDLRAAVQRNGDPGHIR
ncbi:MAG TPA: M67 family metallopeptidase [Symbiobacteriaceae bacterium]|nr:M67 family metallopeptidase [Symbiobacteriaceae bacterium]